MDVRIVTYEYLPHGGSTIRAGQILDNTLSRTGRKVLQEKIMFTDHIVFSCLTPNRID